MTSRNRRLKHTRTRSTHPRAVHKGRNQQPSAKAELDALDPCALEAAGEYGLNVRGEPRSRIEAASSSTDDKGRSNASVDSIRRQLADHVGSLRFVNGALAVCVQALQQQDADMDREIALVIQRTAGDKLDETTDRLEALALGIDPEEVQ